jgi:hypothetical protein
MRSAYETPESVYDPVRLEAVRAGVALISYASVAIDHVQSIGPTRVKVKEDGHRVREGYAVLRAIEPVLIFIPGEAHLLRVSTGLRRYMSGSYHVMGTTSLARETMLSGKAAIVFRERNSPDRCQFKCA